jgi:hypothetical protein
MYEPKHHPPLSRSRFLARVARHAVAAMLLVVASLFAGMAGYEHFENLRWRDAFLNAAMLMGGMGPVDPPRSDGGKIFAGIFALYAGLVFLVTAGLVFAPVIHRILHKFHWQQDR